MLLGVSFGTVYGFMYLKMVLRHELTYLEKNQEIIDMMTNSNILKVYLYNGLTSIIITLIARIILWLVDKLSKEGKFTTETSRLTNVTIVLVLLQFCNMTLITYLSYRAIKRYWFLDGLFYTVFFLFLINTFFTPLVYFFDPEYLWY